MSDIKFTDRQRAAISAPVSNILVSAAAGSGKTAVLTRRIIESLLDPEKNVGIDDMLVVTFTKAAAGELKDRISAALSKAYASDISNKKLRKQLTEIENAHISTIHSFCLDLIKEFHESLSLPSSMKVISSSECAQLYQNIMENVIEARYEKDTEEFNRFVENFISLRDGKIAEMLLEYYQKLLSYPDGVEYVEKSEERLLQVAERGIDGSEYLSKVKSMLVSMCAYFISCCERAIRFLREYGEPYSVQAQVFESDAEYFKTLANTENLKYCEISSLLTNYKFMRMFSMKEKNEEYIYYEKIRNDYKASLQKFCKNFFSQSEEGIKKSAKKSAVFCRELYKTLKLFDTEITKEKVRRSILDYSDLERYAYKLLCENAGKNEAAEKIKRRFAEIYIDEYQDINRTQDALFSAIANKNLFMVGDIKQSIYGFRGSAPELFAKYREEYSDYDPEVKQDNIRIFLTENFRCDKNIIDFSNMVFGSLFRHDRARVKYLPEDALVFKKNSNFEKSEKVTISLVNSGDSKVREQNEARYVALEIEKLIKSGTNPGDIAILLRKTKKIAEIYGAELKKRGIKYKSDTKKELFEQPEIMLLSSMLECLDNPRNDIALSAWLTSPFFGFTLENLSLLSFSGEKGVYKCLVKYLETEKEGALYDKCKGFLSLLNDFRKRSREMSVCDFIRYILSELSFEAILIASSGRSFEISENIESFLSLAATFEANSFCCLSDFVKYIGKLRSGKIEIETARSKSEKENAVKITSVHLSKGLEYPVCFVCDLSRTINNPDAKDNLIVDRELGITLRMHDESGYIKYDTFMRRASARSVTEKLIDEEMRVLYVALTRAKQKLYLTASAENPEELFNKCKRERGGTPSYFAYSENPRFIEWILSSLDMDDCYEIKYIDKDDPTLAKNATIQSESEDEKAVEKIDLEKLEKIKSAIEFEYPWKAEMGLPSKLAVSALYPEILDEEQDVMKRSVKDTPDFLQGEKKATGAERGTATHVFMQFCDFDRVERYGVESEIQRLTEEKYIDQRHAALIYLDKVKAFFKSELYNEIKNSKRVCREYRFNVQMKAEELSEKNRELYKSADSKVLVQGVIDCFFETKNGSYKIIDYKTDRAYGENAEKDIVSEYKYQLMYYKASVEKITGKKVESTSIYAFDLGKEIPVDL